MNEITFRLDQMNAAQLARLYKFLLSIYDTPAADTVYQAGVVNCGAREFCEEVAKA